MIGFYISTQTMNLERYSTIPNEIMVLHVQWPRKTTFNKMELPPITVESRYKKKEQQAEVEIDLKEPN